VLGTPDSTLALGLGLFPTAKSPTERIKMHQTVALNRPRKGPVFTS
jgi:hypothetical protein